MTRKNVERLPVAKRAGPAAHGASELVGKSPLLAGGDGELAARGSPDAAPNRRRFFDGSSGLVGKSLSAEPAALGSPDAAPNRRRFFDGSSGRGAAVIDLSLLKESRALLEGQLDRKGLTFFLATESKQPLFSIDSAKVDAVVRACLAKLDRQGRAIHPRAVAHCRAELRRELIRRVTQAMLRVGY